MTSPDDDSPGSQAAAVPTLAALQAAYPQYRIWLDFRCGRARYVARSLRAGARPHTLVTPDLEELRAGLPARHSQPPRPSPQCQDVAAAPGAAGLS